MCKAFPESGERLSLLLAITHVSLCLSGGGNLSEPPVISVSSGRLGIWNLLLALGLLFQISGKVLEVKQEEA